MFRVSLLHISTSAVALVNILALPRLLGQIGDENNSHSKGSLKSIQCIAFEFKSEIYEIGAISFTSSPSLTSICIPSSVTFLGNQPFSCCMSVLSFTFES
jgi:hypothetical protein